MMPYKKLVGENAEKEFAAFYNAKIQKSKDEIFNDNYILWTEEVNLSKVIYSTEADALEQLKARLEKKKSEQLRPD